MKSLEFFQFICQTDNYCVLIHDAESGQTASIDAPEAGAIEAVLQARGWALTHIFVTHHHGDHTAGNLALKAKHNCEIIGPESERERIPGMSHCVGERSPLAFAGHRIEVLETPGHTLGHLTYYLPQSGVAFTGDTLFSLGCGRVFEGDARTMWSSLQKIASLPDETQVYCGHEYTLANAKFARSVDPDNIDLLKRTAEVERLRSLQRPALPVTIGIERRTNPFLRPHDPNIRNHLKLDGAADWQVFARLRELKNKA